MDPLRLKRQQAGISSYESQIEDSCRRRDELIGWILVGKTNFGNLESDFVRQRSFSQCRFRQRPRDPRIDVVIELDSPLPDQNGQFPDADRGKP